MSAPKYMDVVNYIHKRIEEGTLRRGSKIPSENILTKQLGLSRQTIRHAMEVLESEGVIYKIRGSGTYLNGDGREHTTNRIAVITTYIDSYIFPQIIKGIEEVLSEKGYVMQLSFTNNTFERERDMLLDLIRQGDIAGIIMEPVKSGLPNPNADCYDKLKHMGVPVLFINSYYPGSQIPYVALDDERIAKKAVEYLIQKGHQRIGALLKMDDGQGHLRFAGYASALTEAGIPISEERVVWIDTPDMTNLNSIRDKLVTRFSECSAVFCYNDETATNLIRILNKTSKVVPNQVSVISIDDSFLATLSEVKLTSFPHPMDQLGRKAAENLIEMIHNPSFRGIYRFDSNIVERDSVISIQMR